MQTQKPLVSVILPVYNGADSLSDSVKSILKQSFENFELLICDDASYDRSKAILAEFDDPRITIYTNKFNLGYAGNLNKLMCLSHKNSQYITITEQDDVYNDELFQLAVDYLKENLDYGMVSCIGEHHNGIEKTTQFPGILVNGKNYPKGLDFFLLNYREQLKVLVSGMMFRKSIHQDNKLTFSSKYPNLSVDWDYVLRFSLVSIIGGIHKTLVTLDRRPNRNSLTTNTEQAFIVARALISDFYKEFPDYISKRDYEYALATQMYIELSMHKFFYRIIIIFIKIMFIDPDKNRVINRLNRELKRVSNKISDIIILIKKIIMKAGFLGSK